MLDVQARVLCVTLDCHLGTTFPTFVKTESANRWCESAKGIQRGDTRTHTWRAA